MKATLLVALAVFGLSCDEPELIIGPERVAPSSAPASQTITRRAAPRTLSDHRCAELPFRPTWLPEGWTPDLRPGDGGQVDIPEEEQNPQSYGHYAGEDMGRFVGFYPQDYYFSLAPDALVIEIFGSKRARFGRVHEGFAAEFTAARCPYSVITFGLGRRDSRRFVDGLTFTND